MYFYMHDVCRPAPAVLWSSGPRLLCVGRCCCSEHGFFLRVQRESWSLSYYVSIPTRREEEWAKGMNPFLRLAFCVWTSQEATHNCSLYLLMSWSQKGQHGRALSLASSKFSSFSWKLAVWSHYLYHRDWQVSQAGAFQTVSCFSTLRIHH